MLVIRLQRTGRKHEPTFRVVLTESKNGPKSGKYLKNLGWYDTRIKNDLKQLDVEEIKRLMSQGVKPSTTLHNFLVSKKVIEGKKVNALPKKSPIAKEDVAKDEAKKDTSATPVSKPAPAETTDSPAPAEPEVVATPATVSPEATAPEVVETAK